MTERKLERSMGLLSGISMIVGVIIGCGIFISPVDILKATDNVGMSLIVWLICGIIATLGSLIFAELGCNFQESGGIYTYANELGSVYGFHIMWAMMFVLNPCSIAAKAIAASSNLIQLCFVGCSAPIIIIIIISICIILKYLGLFTHINMSSTYMSNVIQKLFTLMKIAVCIFIFSVGVYNLCIGKYGALENSFDGFFSKLNGGFIIALYQCLFSFNGWYSLNFLTEELKSPERNLPRSIIISLPLIIAIYIMTNIGYLTQISKEEFIASCSIGLTFAGSVHLYATYIIPIFIACSCIGSINGNMLSVTRMYFVAARKNHLPKAFSFIDVTNTPGFSVLFTGVTSIFFVFISKIDVLISAVSFIEACAVLLCVYILIKIRSNKNYKSTLKLNIFIIYIFFILQLMIIIAGLIFQPLHCLLGVVIVLTGIPFYILFVVKKLEINSITSLTNAINYYYQLIRMALPEKNESITFNSEKYEIINDESENIYNQDIKKQ
ncbi:hypothetical protein A3Q56_02946 [Intoshia linei]|uniref:Uncharacterized protein n=1 Tax=Intoshia linei TaxID=1819745 RepID=A0A177B6K0_9BILA|nr:hypothetical protein A3Q56_02946 [Intoshia linei]